MTYVTISSHLVKSRLNAMPPETQNQALRLTERERAPGHVPWHRLKEQKRKSYCPFSLVLAPEQPLGCGGRVCSQQEPKLREGPSFQIRCSNPKRAVSWP